MADMVTMCFMSRAPRPQIIPSARTPPKGGWVHCSRSPAGTTSRWPVSSSGG